MTSGDKLLWDFPADESTDTLARNIGSALAEMMGISLEQFLPIPRRSAPSKIRHASGAFKMLILEDTAMPVEDILDFLGTSMTPSNLIDNTGAFKDRLILGISTHRLINPEATRLQMDTVESMLGLVQRRVLLQRPYTGRQRNVVGIGPYPPYDLVEV